MISAIFVPKETNREIPIDTNVTFRTSSATGSLIFDRRDVTEELITPYNALKIDVLNDSDHNIEEEAEGDTTDAFMEEAIVGNELMVMEEDDILGDDLANLKSPEAANVDPGLQN